MLLFFLFESRKIVMPTVNDEYEWISEETKGINLGDERLNKRLKNLLKRLGDKPSGSFLLLVTAGEKYERQTVFLIISLSQRKRY